MVSRLRRTALYATSVLNAMSSWSVFLEMSTGINGETRDASVAETLGASTRRPSGTSADEAHSLSPFAATPRCSLMPAIRLSFHNLSVMGTKSKAYGGRLVIRSGCVKGGSTASEPFKHFVRNGQNLFSDWVWRRSHLRFSSVGTVLVQIPTKASAAGESGRLHSVTSTKGRTRVSPRTLSVLTA